MLAARGLHQADNAVRVWAVVEALGLEREARPRALEEFRAAGRPGRADPGGGSDHPERLLQCQPSVLPRRHRHRRGAPGQAPAGLRRRAPCGSWARTPRALHRRGRRRAGRAARRICLRRWATSSRRSSRMPRPWASGWSRAADPLALAPLLTPRLRGRRDRGAESIPRSGAGAYTSGARGPREAHGCSPGTSPLSLRTDVLSLARPARQAVHHFQSLQLHQLPRRGGHRHGAACWPSCWAPR